MNQAFENFNIPRQYGPLKNDQATKVFFFFLETEVEPKVEQKQETNFVLPNKDEDMALTYNKPNTS